MPEFFIQRIHLAADWCVGLTLRHGADYLSGQMGSSIRSLYPQKHHSTKHRGTAARVKDRWSNPMPNGWSSCFDSGPPPRTNAGSAYGMATDGKPGPTDPSLGF